MRSLKNNGCVVNARICEIINVIQKDCLSAGIVLLKNDGRGKMGLFEDLKKRANNPDGFLGSLILYGTNRVHAGTLNWGLSNLSDQEPREIVEIGCGSGRNAAVLLIRYPYARVTAVEQSPFLIEKATANNRKFITEGRCTVERMSPADLRLEEEHFDLAVAFDTIYHWPDLAACLAQAKKVLKPGGIFLIVNETDGNEAVKIRYEKNDDSMKCYTPEEIQKTLSAAGFADPRSRHHPKEQWIAVWGEKPELRRKPLLPPEY